ncbi:HAD-IIB family hydrolase [Anaeromicropila populeti]|uniref:Haloacid dehalogenase-like hydrolase n=1 Tax=Anaeromicropila populeti TaxID=37658 RepID=A0A1I6IMN3_9FIRM|nr:HAD-IIB family hydrolase [Anaeromicropila populeti]SFR67983.1 haloacid dehalogenase-like hydrolase [Anaeromicropila populeti]
MDRKKIFVFDLDGTIIENNQPLDNSINDVLKKLICCGHHIIFSTARSIRGAAHVLPEWCQRHTIIYCNGAFAEQNKKLIFSTPIASDRIANLLEIVDLTGNPYYVELGHYFYHPDSQHHSFYNSLQLEGPADYIQDKSILFEKPVYKIVILENQKQTNFRQLLSLHAFHNLEMYYHSDGSIDIVAENCTKWTALSHILGSHTAYDIISFGNDINDIDLLKYSTFGIAVNPQCEQLKQIADKVLDFQGSHHLINTILDFI